jgi:hypothetical protein
MKIWIIKVEDCNENTGFIPAIIHQKCFSTKDKTIDTIRSILNADISDVENKDKQLKKLKDFEVSDFDTGCFCLFADKSTGSVSMLSVYSMMVNE